MELHNVQTACGMRQKQPVNCPWQCMSRVQLLDVKGLQEPCIGSRSCRSYLLHGIRCENAKDDRNPRIQAGIQQAACCGTHHCLIVGGGAPDLPCWLLRSSYNGAADKIQYSSITSIADRPVHAVHPKPWHTTVPMAKIALYLPLFAMLLAMSGSSKLPGTHTTCRCKQHVSE